MVAYRPENVGFAGLDNYCIILATSILYNIIIYLNIFYRVNTFGKSTVFQCGPVCTCTKSKKFVSEQYSTSEPSNYTTKTIT